MMRGAWDLFYTPTHAYCNDSNVLINFDNLSRRKVLYDLGGMHIEVMGVKQNKTAFVI